MNDELKQHISEFLDDELDHADSLKLLQSMQQNHELTDTLNRYAAISHLLKNKQHLPIAKDFTATISTQIEQEAFYLLPKRKQTKPVYKMLALAASIAAIAVITTNTIKNPTESPQLAQQQVAQQKTTQPAPTKETEQYPLNARINDYLQAHNNSVYTNGQADFRPLAKVTAYNSQK